jgi:hypothetical protein
MEGSPRGGVKAGRNKEQVLDYNFTLFSQNAFSCFSHLFLGLWSILVSPWRQKILQACLFLFTA